MEQKTKFDFLKTIKKIKMIENLKKGTFLKDFLRGKQHVKK